MRSIKLSISSFLLFLFATPVSFAETTNFKFFGQPLVPACGAKNVCTVCDIFRLLQNLINFGLSLMVLVAIVMLAWGGIEMLLASASPKLLESGKKKITRSLSGITIVLVAWLLIDTFIKIIAGQNITGGVGQIPGPNGIGPWNAIQCEAPPFRDQAQSSKGGTSGSIQDWENSQGDEGTALKNPQGGGTCADTSAYNEAINEAAARYGVSPDRIRAIISTESGGNINTPPSNDNDGGHSYGLMQMRLETARELDPSATLDKLRDPAYNIDLGTRYYAKLKQKYGSDDLASAAYNGGERANQPSVDCAGEPSPHGGTMRRWECKYDDKAHTVENRGYKVTRDYVPKVDNFEQQYTAGTCT